MPTIGPTCFNSQLLRLGALAAHPHEANRSALLRILQFVDGAEQLKVRLMDQQQTLAVAGLAADRDAVMALLNEFADDHPPARHDCLDQRLSIRWQLRAPLLDGPFDAIEQRSRGFVLV